MSARERERERLASRRRDGQKRTLLLSEIDVARRLRYSPLSPREDDEEQIAFSPAKAIELTAQKRMRRGAGGNRDQIAPRQKPTHWQTEYELSF